MTNRLDTARNIMKEYLIRTGVLDNKHLIKRYLWTDAFAVLNLLDLTKKTGDTIYEIWAESLVNQVHVTLGKHRLDDPAGRTGWLTGLLEEEGALHPTAAGLRIGKDYPERRPDEPFDDDAEWDKDGQYYHYLTKWMIALVKMSEHFKEHRYLLYAYELAKVAHEKFTFVPSSVGSGPVGYEMHWKMSIDLSRPLTHQMGAHDPLDGFLTYWDIEQASLTWFKDHHKFDLSHQRHQLFGIIRCLGVTDSLGLGGLILDLKRICSDIQFFSDDDSFQTQRHQFDHLLNILLDALTTSLASFNQQSLKRDANVRLAFREFGLAMGLISLDNFLEANLLKNIPIQESLMSRLVDLQQYVPMGDEIVKFWTDEKHQNCRTWREHEDINSVMLATCLIKQALSVSN